MRILLKLEYVGTAFHGWQRQAGLRTVQGEVEEAVRLLSGETVSVQASGRTDAGVHALGQTAHFDTNARIPARQYLLGLNHYLPADVKVRQVWEVPPDFHARFDAREKTYQYRMYLSRSASPVRETFSLQVVPPIDVEKMKRAAASLVGEHDFDALRSRSEPVTSTVRTVYRSELSLEGEDLTYTVTGNGFLYNMVRITVGTLLSIGRGKFPEDYFERLFREGGKLKPGKCVLGKGLFLTEVKY